MQDEHRIIQHIKEFKMIHIEMIYDPSTTDQFSVVKLEAVTTVGNVVNNTHGPMNLDPNQVVQIMDAVYILNNIANQTANQRALPPTMIAGSNQLTQNSPSYPSIGGVPQGAIQQPPKPTSSSPFNRSMKGIGKP